MFAEIDANGNLIKFPYNFSTLGTDNPYTNFSSSDLLTAYKGTTANLAGNNLVAVIEKGQPAYDTSSQICTKNKQPTLVDGVWTLDWTVAQMTAEQKTQADEAQATNVRSFRNDKLNTSDWTQVADAPVDKAAWATYRQALRDLTKEPGFPWTMTWPTDPTGAK